MPVVTLPDGSEVDFPEGTSQQEMNQALDQYYKTTVSSAPQQMAGPLRYPAMAGQSFIQGLTGALGLPGDIQQLFQHYTGAQLPLPLLGPVLGINLPTSEQLRYETARLGLQPTANLQPGEGRHPTLEHLLAGGASGLGAVAPTIPLGGEGALLPTLFSGLASGVAHEYGDITGGPAAGTTLGLLAGLGAGGVTSTVQRGVNALRGNLNPAAQLFSDAGIPMRSMALTGEGGPIQRSLESFAPVDQTKNDIAQMIENRAAGLGQSRTLQEAGNALQDEARNWLANVRPAKEKAVWDEVDKLIPGNTPVQLSHFGKTLDDITTDAGSLQDLVETLRPKLPQQLKSMLGKKTGLAGLTGGQYAPDWQEARTLRAALGDALDSASISDDAGQGNLRKLYAAVSSDLRDAAGSLSTPNDPYAGIAAQKAFKIADDESTRLRNFTSNIVGKIVRSKNPAQAGINPESAASAMLSGGKKGGTPISALRNEMPAAADELAAAHLRTIGLADSTDPKSELSGSWQSKWEGLSPEAKEALVPDPGARKALSASAQIANNLKGLGKGEKAQTLPGIFIGGAAAPLFTHYVLGSPMLGMETVASEPIGQAMGAIAPWAINRARTAAANSPLLAGIQAGQGPIWAFPRQPLTSALLPTLSPSSKGNK